MKILKLSQLPVSEFITNPAYEYKRVYQDEPYLLIIDDVSLEFEWYKTNLLNKYGKVVDCYGVRSQKFVVVVPE